MITRLIPTNEPPKIQNAILRNRPQKLSYIVNRSINSGTLRQVFEYNSSIWGGYYNIFIPTDGKLIREDWWLTLMDYDPDIVMFVGEISEGLKTQVLNEIQPFKVYDWNEWTEHIYNGYRYGSDALLGIQIDVVIRHYHDTKGLVEKTDSNCIYPLISYRDQSNIFPVLFGYYPSQSFEKYYRSVFGAFDLSCSLTNLPDYLKLLEDTNDRFYPIMLTKQYLNTIFSEPENRYGTAIVLANEIDDLFLYHALRIRNSNTILIPSDLLKSKKQLKTLSTWLFSTHMNSWVTLLSANGNLAKLRRVRDKLREDLPSKEDLPSEVYSIDIRVCNIITAFPLAYTEEEQKPITIQGEYATIYRPELLFSSWQLNWITELDLSPITWQRTGFTPPKFPKLNFVLSGDLYEYGIDSQNYNVRLSKNKILLKTSRRDKSKQIFLLNSSSLAENLFESYGYSSSLDEKGRYYQGMIELMGGLDEFRLLQDEIGLAILSNKEVMKRGEPIKLNDFVSKILSEVKVASSMKGRTKIEQWLHEFALKSIFLRGYELRCPNCKLELHYPITEVVEQVQCRGCLSMFQIPLDAMFSFKINELFRQGIIQGARTILLSLLFLKSLSNKGFLWSVGHILEKNGKKSDVDLVAMIDGNLILIECKDNFKTDRNTISEIKKQLAKDIGIAKEINANIFIFSTLKKEIPKTIQNFISKQNHREKNLTIMCIDGSDLCRGHALKETRPILELSHFLKRKVGCTRKCHENDPLSEKHRLFSH